MKEITTSPQLSPLTPTKRKSITTPITNGVLTMPDNPIDDVHHRRCLPPFAQQHRRIGSTGTTGDESYTTDDEDDAAPVISTITDKITTTTPAAGGGKTMHRNSSDSSVYSGGEEEEEEEEEGTTLGWRRQTFVRLQDELKDAHEELKLKDEEVNRLSRIRKDVEAELEDLTASLFQEAHNMVRTANEKQAAAEKALKESQMKVDVLTAEVAALKTLVLTSTPSRPNPHLHPQIQDSIFAKKHRRSPSHYNLKYGRESSPPESPVREPQRPVETPENKEGSEVDPDVHSEFLDWRQKPTLDKGHAFVARMYREDIDLCLDFKNRQLGENVRKAVENGTILVESIGDRAKTMFPKKCALLEVPRLCFYRMNIGDANDWYSISQICRNRIIAVCDFLNYLKYIERGLVKSSAHDVYWEIVRLRKEMVLARLGLNIST